MQRFACSTLLAALAFCCVAFVSSASADAVKVELKSVDGKWQLLREGKPYLAKGVGGGASKEAAVKLGANSFRTWGADDAQAQLDEAQKLGVTVCVGIWLGQERHHFNYDNAGMVAEQYERARKTVLKFKDHPALLCWALGNETEGYKEGDNPAIWGAINNIAALVHTLDPNHPTMTVISEVGGQRIKNVHRLCPEIDIVGINSYAGAESIPERYKKGGGTKPYMLTEFGPPGTWETKKNAWGCAPELSSTAKADWYRKAYEANAVRAAGLCVGTYAFTWGFKQEATSTWYGLVFPDGARTQAVDTLSELWTGRLVVNHCPRIEGMSVVGESEVDPAAAVRVSLNVVDPEKDPMKVEWKLYRDPLEYKLGGDREESPPMFPEAIVKSSDKGAELKMPQAPGAYRLFAFIRDDHGGGAVANVPLRVKRSSLRD